MRKRGVVFQMYPRFRHGGLMTFLSSRDAIRCIGIATHTIPFDGSGAVRPHDNAGPTPASATGSPAMPGREAVSRDPKSSCQVVSAVCGDRTHKSSPPTCSEPEASPPSASSIEPTVQAARATRGKSGHATVAKCLARQFTELKFQSCSAHFLIVLSLRLLHSAVGFLTENDSSSSNLDRTHDQRLHLPV